MDLSKLNPWNWFKHEQPRSQEQIPVKRHDYHPAQMQDPFDSLHREFDRLFENFLQRWQRPASELLPGSGEGLLSPFQGKYWPKLNIAAEDDHYQITIEVPGLKADDIELELNDRVLTIKGHSEVEQKDEQARYYRIERASGYFQRTLNLPDDADGEGIRARMDKGLMSIHIPRNPSQTTPAKRIPIEH